MAEAIIYSTLKPAMEQLGRFAVEKLKPLFTFLCCFNSIIEGLTDEDQKLENARVGLQRQVDADEDNGQVILPEVETWLRNANKIQTDKKAVDERIPTVKNDYWSVKSRFQLSSEAVKITGKMKQLNEDRSRFNGHISTRPVPLSRAEIQLGTTYDFQSRKKVEEDIMKDLKAEEITTMGICGMGGVGKTTMAKRIMDRAQKENIFHEIVMVVVSQQVDNLKIQGAIAESLGLELSEEFLIARATKLRERLTAKERILIVFDDVWEKLKLEDLGIPCGNDRCTILFTSRNKEVLEKKMDIQNVYEVGILSDEEAWLFFKEKTGPCVDDLNLVSTAEEVARECKGLPIALITVGGALKKQTNITVWKDALQQLKSFNPEDMVDVIKDVYYPLKLSYTYLRNKRAQSLFLLCSLFPEDYEISLEELTSFCMGLRMFRNLGFTSEGILEMVRGRVSTIADMLKNCFLLLNGKDEHHVRMHDVVRDVAIYIASNEAEEGIVDVKYNLLRPWSRGTYAWVSVFSKDTSSLLRMYGSNRKEKFENKEFSIFKEINKELNLLSFENICLKSIPLEIQLLRNLQTLHLKRCSLESFSVVGELRSLEILHCYGCHDIEELPVEIGNLNQLKLFDFTHCSSLKRIPPGVISKLEELEEFKMFNSFNKWELAAAEVQRQEGRNACLNEFRKLSKLTCLEIDINDFNLAAEEISFSPNIIRHCIQIGDKIGTISFYDTSIAKGMDVQLPRDIKLGSWILRFLRGADRLNLKGDVLKSLDLPQAHNMKALRIEDCCTDKELVNASATSNDDLSKFDVFPILERLELVNLPNLEEIYDGPALRHLWKTRPNRNIVSFDKLREITIEKCNNIHNLFSFLTSVRTDRDFDELLCTQKVFFPMLEKLNLWVLDKLEVVWDFPISKESNSFRNLKELMLFKNLKDVKLCNLSAMTHLWKNPNLSILLNNLSEVYIWGCPKLRSVFSSTMPMDFLPQLAKVHIGDCEMMEQVCLKEENENNGNQFRTIKFLKLLSLSLVDMKSLMAFGKGIETIEFPMLEDMTIKNCPKLMSDLTSNGNNQTPVDDHEDDTFHLFCNQKISFSSLKRVSISMSDKLYIWFRQIPPDSFSKLEELYISSRSGIRSLFSLSIAVYLVNLKELSIQRCKEMEKLIEDDEDMVIKSISVLPVLEYMLISDCPKLMSLVPSAGNDQNPTGDHDNDTFHLFCSNQISGNLKRVCIAHMDKRSIWCRQIPPDFFCQLEELEIDSCHAISSLFSSSIAKSLVNIKDLKIFYCNEMEKVIEDDEEMSCEGPRILFPNLKELLLSDLPKLECFCHWNDLQLPLLEQVKIYECPLLKLFPINSVTTPNLRSVDISTEEESTSTEASEVETNHDRSEIEEEEIEQAFSDN